MVGVGILGFAHGHVNSYCKEWTGNSDYGVNVVAGWDHDAERLTKAVADFGPVACADPATLLARTDVQAVVIAAETSLHAELVVQAAAAGKTIVLQKPMALTMAQADQIVAAVNAAGVPFTMAWQMRVDPQNLEMKSLIESGVLGKVFMVRRRHGLAINRMANFANLWHASAEYNRDIWADDASHPIDMLQWLLGVPESVTAEISSLDDPRLPNDNGVAVFRYPNGMLAEVFCSFTCSAAENTTEIFAEHGSVIQNYGDVPSCNVPRPADAVGLKWYLAAEGRWTQSSIASPAGHGERIAGLSRPLADFLNGKRGPIATVEEARTSLRMVLACYVSTREGRRVAITDPAINAV